MTEVDASDYKALAVRLKALDRKLAARVRARLREIGKPLGEEVIREGAEAMPARGGLRERLVTGGKVGVSTLRSSVAIRLQEHRGIQLGPLNRGKLRHPTFNGAPWVSQPVPAGSYSAAFQVRRDEVAREVMDEMTRLLEELE